MRPPCSPILAAAAAAFPLAAAAPAGAQIRVGITVSASGPGAALGQPQMRTVKALPNEIAGQQVTYVALDDESDPTKSAQNARKLITEDKVDVLIGSSLTPTTLPLLDIAAETKTPLLTLAAAAAPVPPAEGSGEGYHKVLSGEAPKLGTTLTAHEGYARSDDSATGQVLKVTASKPDAVFLASAGAPAVLPQKGLREGGYKGPIFQTHGVATEEFIKLGGKDVEGAVFTGEAFTIADDLPASSPFRKPTQEYVKAYEAVHSQKPNIFGAHLWDTMELVANAAPEALKHGKPGTAEFRSALRDALERTRNVYLNNGLSNMSPTDHNGYDERSAFLIRVDGGKFRLLERK